MPNTQTEMMRVGPWTGGSKPDIAPMLLGLNDIASCENVDFLVDGTIRKRRGYTKWSTSDPAAANYGRWLFRWEDSAGNVWLIYVDNDNELYHVNATSGTTLSRAQVAGPTDITIGADAETALAGMDSKMYVSSHSGGNEGVWSFDGTTWTAITDNTLDGSGTEFPIARYLLNKHERIFAARLDDNTAARQSRLWWSEAGDAETWLADSWIDFDPDDGSQITGIYSVGDRIVVFKDSSTYVLVGADPLTFTVFQVSNKIGLRNSLAVAEVNNVIYWYDDQTRDVYSFDGATITRIADVIRERIVDNIDEPTTLRPYKARAFGWRDKFLLSMAWSTGGGGTDNTVQRTFVYDTRHQRWTEYDVAFQDLVEVDGVLYGVGPAHEGETPAIGVFTVYAASDLNDNGTNIASHFHTPWITPRTFLEDFRLRRLQLYTPGEATSPATLTVALHTDWDSVTEVSSTTHSNSGTVDYVVGELAGFEQILQSVSMHVENDSANEWEVDAIDLLVSRRIRQRGVDA